MRSDTTIIDARTEIADGGFEMLQSGGIMVINLHCGHLRYDIHVDRIRRSFNEAVPVVVDGELSNSIVFACKGISLVNHMAFMYDVLHIIIALLC